MGHFSKKQRKKAGWLGMKTAGLGYVELPFTAWFVGRVIYTASALLLLRGNDLSLCLMFSSRKAAPRYHTLGLSLPLVWGVWRRGCQCEASPLLCSWGLSAHRKHVSLSLHTMSSAGRPSQGQVCAGQHCQGGSNSGARYWEASLDADIMHVLQY